MNLGSRFTKKWTASLLTRKKKTNTFKEMNISNSTLNAYRDYKYGKACGLQVQAIYIDKTVKFERTDEQKAGMWFEYKATGATNLDGTVPEEITTKTGKTPAIIEHLTGQLENFKNIYANVEIENKGYLIKHELNNRKFIAILDVQGKMNEQIIIRDIKTTGLLDNKWEPSGWQDLMGNDSFIPRKKHLNQAQFYIWLFYQVTGEIVPFYFDVFSNKNPYDCKIFKIEMDESTLGYYEVNLIKTIENLELDLKKGLEAKPDVDRCRKCPLNSNCTFKTNLPEIENILL